MREARDYRVRHNRWQWRAGRLVLPALLVLLWAALPAGCGSQPPAPGAPAIAPFELQVKFANVDEAMQVLTAVATLSPGDATHITLDFWDIQLEPGEAYRPVGHVSRSESENLNIAIELYGQTELRPGGYLFGSDYPDCCVPSITYGGVEYQLAPHPQQLGQVQLESVELTEGGKLSGYVDLACYYGEIIRGSFTAVVHLR